MKKDSTEVSYKVVPSLGEMFRFLYWVFAMIYTFKVWGFWWGFVSIVLPIFPLINLAQYFVHLVT